MTNYKPTESELEILSILWEFGPSTVKFVNDKLNEKKEVGYTTTLKIMQIMFDKKLISREKLGRSHIYKSKIKKDETQGILLEKILETAFSGSASKLIMQALGRSKTSKKEIEEIKKYIEKIERGQGGAQ
ncbi:MAG: BlaI/MecI/CopY family transcriptional regulator [Ignavibacteriales bacterium]|nr:BlaI/MecI/CopY family transcriptional regulator [Ignavibacteriales bacterium]MCB9219621.1 BlaI/MecI/CopY family transcriptional regulator [Ignavibacteriales bacterium]